MLIYFTAGNFLSFYDCQTLKMTAAPSCKERIEDNTHVEQKRRLLLSSVIYGANASGKTNLYKAMLFFQRLVLTSAQDMQGLQVLQGMRNKLNSEAETTPTSFEIAFLQNGSEFRYGFEVTPKRIVKEWLYEGKKVCFLRTLVDGEDTIQIDKSWEKANGLEERTRDNALFLSVCATFAIDKAQEIVTWIGQKFIMISAAEPGGFTGYTVARIQQNPSFKDKVVAFLKNADMNVEGIELVNNELSLPVPNKDGSVMFQKQTVVSIFTRHHVYDANGDVRGETLMPFESHESLGTQKALALAGPIIHALESGSVLVVDELDSRLHPVFTRQIVKMFNSSKDNPCHAQLIFNTHDTNLLSFKVYNPQTKEDEYLYRRDQIFFTEKDNCERTHLYSLIEFKEQSTGRKVRNDASFEKDYLNGLYGAIPFIGKLFEMGEASK